MRRDKKLESEDRANGVVVVAVALNEVAHTERNTRTGAEAPRVGVGVLRRRPNELIGRRGTKSYFFTAGCGDTGIDFGKISRVI